MTDSRKAVFAVIYLVSLFVFTVGASILLLMDAGWGWLGFVGFIAYGYFRRQTDEVREWLVAWWTR